MARHTQIRLYQVHEAMVLWALLRDTVHTVNAEDYSQSQLEAWAPAQIDEQAWVQRMQETKPLVAVHDQRIVGFSGLAANGRLDCFYCACDSQGQGVGSALLEATICRAKHHGLRTIETEASITAKTFFLAHGFMGQRSQVVMLRGQQFINYRMSRRL